MRPRVGERRKGTRTKKTLCQIIESGNDYLVKVKANQPKLYQAIETESKQQTAQQTVEDVEKTRNRQTLRRIEVFEPPKNIDPKWRGVGCVMKVESSGIRGDEPYQSISYYICSLPAKSKRLADGIREHWQIENNLHWGGMDGEPVSSY